MMSSLKPSRIVPARHGSQSPKLSPEYELELSTYLRAQYSRSELVDL